MKKITVLLLTISLSFLSAQSIIDGIAAIVGNNIVLFSEVEQVARMTASQMGINPNRDTANYNALKRSVLNSLVDENILLEQAMIETVTVKDRDVENALNQRIDALIQQAGSQENAESYLGGPIGKVKKDYRPIMKNSMTVEKLRSEKFAKTSVSRKEVEQFYNTYKDSLPPIPPSLDFSSIFVKIKPGEAEMNNVRKLADSLLSLIKNGADFANLAREYSEDRSSAEFGGDLGYIKRGAFIKSFEEAAFALQTGEISDIVQTEFGLHIIQLIDRKGESINVRHILLMIKVSETNIDEARQRIEMVRSLLTNNEITFDSAVVKYSDEQDAKVSLGRIRRIPKNQIQNEIFASVLDTLKVGNLSDITNTETGFYILKLNNVYDDTWSTLEKYALEFKKNLLYQDWLTELKKNIYVELKPVN